MLIHTQREIHNSVSYKISCCLVLVLWSAVFIANIYLLMIEENAVLPLAQFFLFFLILIFSIELSDDPANRN